MQLTYLTYYSRLHIDTIQEYATLATQCQANNAGCEVTGILIMADGFAFQVLEGPRQHVSRTYNRVAKDRRHSDVTLCLAEDTSDRYFPKSPMTVVDAVSSYPEVIETYRHGGKLQPQKMTGHVIWDMIARISDETERGLIGGLRAASA